jgi:hypothetical protein
MADWSLEQLSLWVRLLLPLRTRAVDQRDTRRMRARDVRGYRVVLTISLMIIRPWLEV